MPEIEQGFSSIYVFLDAGMFIGAFLKGDRRHAEARHWVEHARSGALPACTTASVLSEGYGALTWEKAEPRHGPSEAATAVKLKLSLRLLSRSLKKGVM
jgi:predicted nucleic acid-binding protein